MIPRKLFTQNVNKVNMVGEPKETPFDYFGWITMANSLNKYGFTESHLGIGNGPTISEHLMKPDNSTKKRIFFTNDNQLVTFTSNIDNIASGAVISTFDLSRDISNNIVVTKKSEETLYSLLSVPLVNTDHIVQIIQNPDYKNDFLCVFQNNGIVNIRIDTNGTIHARNLLNYSLYVGDIVNRFYYSDTLRFVTPSIVVLGGLNSGNSLKFASFSYTYNSDYTLSTLTNISTVTKVLGATYTSIITDILQIVSEDSRLNYFGTLDGSSKANVGLRLSIDASGVLSTSSFIESSTSYTSGRLNSIDFGVSNILTINSSSTNNYSASFSDSSIKITKNSSGARLLTTYFTTYTLYDRWVQMKDKIFMSFNRGKDTSGSPLPQLTISCGVYNIKLQGKRISLSGLHTGAESGMIDGCLNQTETKLAMIYNLDTSPRKDYIVVMEK